MMKKANKQAEPILLKGKKGWHIGRTPDGKDVFQLEKGFAHLKNGNVEFGKNIDEEGNFTDREETVKETEE